MYTGFEHNSNILQWHYHQNRQILPVVNVFVVVNLNTT